jgi:hypothetical protein
MARLLEFIVVLVRRLLGELLDRSTAIFLLSSLASAQGCDKDRYPPRDFDQNQEENSNHSQDSDGNANQLRGSSIAPAILKSPQNLIIVIIILILPLTSQTMSQPEFSTTRPATAFSTRPQILASPASSSI